ncbi:hypothetical protein STENM223S_04248 [Streptomyces tendae]
MTDALDGGEGGRADPRGHPPHGDRHPRRLRPEHRPAALRVPPARPALTDAAGRAGRPRCRCRASTRTTSTWPPSPSSGSARPATTATSCCCGTRRDWAPPWLALGGRLHCGFTGGASPARSVSCRCPAPRWSARSPRPTAAASRESAGAQAVPRLARELGVERRFPAGPVRGGGGRAAGARRDPPRRGPHCALLRTYATRLATGLASLTRCPRPRARRAERHRPHRGRRAAARAGPGRAGGTGRRSGSCWPVSVRTPCSLRGALESALAATRDEVFDTSR